VFHFGVSLLLLCLGWNLCYVAGTTLLADRLAPGERGRAQGFNDFLVGSVSALGSVATGAVFAAAGYVAVAALGAAVAVALAGVAVLAPAPAPFDAVRRRG
jgi:hypothetical protein